VSDPKARKAPVQGWETSRGWGWVWGDDDQVGAANAITPASIVEALGNVTQGRVYDLGVEIDRGSFLWSGHVGTEVVTFRTPEGLLRHQDLGLTDRQGLSFHTSMVMLSDHAGTQLDGLCHATFGEDQHWYNGFDVDRYTTDFGPIRAGAENIPPIIANAVLIDVPAHLGVDELEPSFVIGSELLQATLDAQGVDVAPGEAVLIRTGTMRHWGETGDDHEALSGGTAGINLEGARWLVETKGAMLIASDTSTLEVIPPVDGDNPSPAHKYLLVDQGVHMGELHYLEDLSRDRVYRFCYIALTPKVRGTTAGFALRPIAIV